MTADMLPEAAKPNVLAEELNPNGLLPSVIENVLLAVPAFPAKSVHDEPPFPLAATWIVAVCVFAPAVNVAV